ncbi:MAG: hypothetical protein ACYDEV_15895 [Acidiferrobacter sp.]
MPIIGKIAYFPEMVTGKRASDRHTLVIRPSGGDHRERAILNEKKRVESVSDECRADPLFFISLIDGDDRVMPPR